jgi:chaperonin GroES
MVEAAKKIRRISPLGFRVVVKIDKEPQTTEAGLYLPEGAKEKMSDSVLAVVTEVASAKDTDTDEETNISGIPLGAKVLIQKDSGIKVPWDNSYRIVNTQDVLAIVNEILLS